MGSNKLELFNKFICEAEQNWQTSEEVAHNIWATAAALDNYDVEADKESRSKKVKDIIWMLN